MHVHVTHTVSCVLSRTHDAVAESIHLVGFIYSMLDQQKRDHLASKSYTVAVQSKNEKWESGGTLQSRSKALPEECILTLLLVKH